MRNKSHCFDWLFIVHRYSRKYLMIFGILAWTACTLASSFMQDYTSFCVMRSLIGFGEAGFRFTFYRTLLLGADWFGSSALILTWRLINSDWNNISGEPANLARKVCLFDTPKGGISKFWRNVPNIDSYLKLVRLVSKVSRDLGGHCIIFFGIRTTKLN